MPPPSGPPGPLAVWVSRVFHPFVVPLPVLVAALRLSGSSWHAALGWTLVCVGGVILPSVALLVRERRRSGDGDWFVTAREQRRGLYGLGIACLLALLPIAHLLGAPRLLVASLVSALVATVLGAVLNRVTKPSVHVGASAGSAVLLSHAAPLAGAALGLAALGVAWSRIRLAHHTPLQVALGGGIGAGCAALALRLLG